ncbi:hypothetical protein CEXT_395141 [Caerostris extrusa]|uniref:Uncharacterized protein n=1 Tax=Caerostris extrusa TaxID=172846 RepID=A0AAV4W9U5_CAEEX|nr:hypothetical protein CEXT_395141 [Caerostris extrusa]
MEQARRLQHNRTPHLSQDVLALLHSFHFPPLPFNRLPSQKNCFHVPPSLRIVPSSVPSPPLSPPLPRTPAPEEKYIEGQRRKKNDSGERRFNSYMRWLQLSSCSAI